MLKKLLLIIILTVPAFVSLIRPGYFPHHDDLQAIRQLEMAKCFADGQIPCRWVLDMGYGYGYPLFNFYPPLPYLIGMPFHWLGLQYIDIVKVVGILGFMVSAVGMYLLAKDVWQSDKAGVISSLLYTYAPYHSVDYYVRGAMNEFWALAIFPYIWLLLRRMLLSDRPIRYLPLTALSISLLLLSHNPTTMIFAPITLVWVVYWLFKSKQPLVARFIYLGLSGLLGLGVASFFTLPVVLEQQYAHLETLIIGYFNYLAHFADLNQIFLSINWGYGASELGPGDGMSFALGYLQWIIPLLTLIAVFLLKKLNKYRLLVVLLIGLGLVSLFMAHSKSTFLWKIITPLAYLQFPWRFLTLGIFLFSLVGGVIASLLGKKVLGLLVVAIILINLPFFQPAKWLPQETDASKFSGKSWHLQVTGSIFDYLPIQAPLPPADPPAGDLVINSPLASYVRIEKKTNIQKYKITSLKPTQVQVQTYYFPGWQAYIDGQLTPIDSTSDKLLGRIQVDMPAGDHELVLRFTNTPVRNLANLISLISLGIIIVVIRVGRRKK